MANQHDIATFTLVANAGDFNVPYPALRQSENYSPNGDHMIVTNSGRTLYSRKNEFALSFGASNISVTGLVTVISAGTIVFLHLDRADSVGESPIMEDVVRPDAMGIMQLVKVNLGVPATAVANGVCASQALTAASAPGGLINGGLAAGGVATFDVPRNVVAAWTNTAVITVTGTGEYGRALSESSASGTSFTGKKAFKTITSVRVSADVTGLTVGSGVVLGLPVFLADVPDVLREYQDGVAPTAGTVVAGVNVPSTPTTGDVRGTYAPNAAPNGARNYELLIAVRSALKTGS